MKRLSIIICNYNYERFVGTAIDSALALRWDDLEVIVVDDGSTDGSPAVIRSYGNRIRAVLTENATQRVAANRGFALSTGDVVIFLDSDDALPADLPGALAAAWTPAVSKAQFRVQRVDEAGVRSGQPFPSFDPVPAPADIRRWMSRTSAYPTPPGSGNAYARWFLDRILPAGPEVGDASDSALLAAAPFAGDVISLPGVVVAYRRHGANDSNLVADPRRFPREVARARARWRFAQQSAGVPAADIDDGPLFRSRELLQLRVAAARLAPDEPGLPGDSRRRMLTDALRAPWQPGPESKRHRAVVCAWSCAALVVPAGLARLLITYRYGSRTNPAVPAAVPAGSASCR